MNIRKGISPLIATLLLIAIAVAASVLTYSWVMSMVGSQSAQAQTQVRIDNVNWAIAPASGAADVVTVTIRNTGSVAATIESLSIRMNKAGSTTYVDDYYVAAGTNNAVGSIDVGGTLILKMDSAHPLITTTQKSGWAALPGADYMVNSQSFVVKVTTTTGFFYESVVTSPAA